MSESKVSEVTQDWEAARKRVRARHPNAMRSGKGWVWVSARHWRAWIYADDGEYDFDLSRGMLGTGWLDADRRLQEGSAMDGEATPPVSLDGGQIAEEEYLPARQWSSSASPAEDAVEGFEAFFARRFPIVDQLAASTDQRRNGMTSAQAKEAKDACRVTWQAAKATPQAQPVVLPEDVLEAAKRTRRDLAVYGSPDMEDVRTLTDFTLRLAELQEARHGK